MAALISTATGREPYFIGKPNPLMMRSALNRLDAHSETTVMVGDRMDTDIISGLEAGLRTVLVDHRLHPARPGRDLPLPADPGRRLDRRPRRAGARPPIAESAQMGHPDPPESAQMGRPEPAESAQMGTRTCRVGACRPPAEGQEPTPPVKVSRMQPSAPARSSHRALSPATRPPPNSTPGSVESITDHVPKVLRPTELLIVAW